MGSHRPSAVKGTRLHVLPPRGHLPALQPRSTRKESGRLRLSLMLGHRREQGPGTVSLTEASTHVHAAGAPSQLDPRQIGPGEVTSPARTRTAGEDAPGAPAGPSAPRCLRARPPEGHRRRMSATNSRGSRAAGSPGSREGRKAGFEPHLGTRPDLGTRPPPPPPSRLS